MFYFNFLIKKEDIFLKNIYSSKDLNKSPNIKNLESYYPAFKKIFRIIIFMENDLINCGIVKHMRVYHMMSFLE